MFNITAGKGFQITFENGWTFSVQFGPGNYCSNKDRGDFDKEIAYMKGEVAECEASSAEIAIIRESDAHWLHLLNDRVAGWCTPEQVARILGLVASLSPDPMEEEFNRLREIL